MTTRKTPTPPAPPGVPDRRAGGTGDRDVWITVGKMQADHAHLKDRVQLAESNIAVLTSQGQANAGRLNSIDHRLDTMDVSLQVLPKIVMAFDRSEKQAADAVARAERHQRAVNTVLTRNSSNVAMLMGLIGASILQRVGTIPLYALYGAVAGGVAYFLYSSFRTYMSTARP